MGVRFTIARFRGSARLLLTDDASHVLVRQGDAMPDQRTPSSYYRSIPKPAPTEVCEPLDEAPTLICAVLPMGTA